MGDDRIRLKYKRRGRPTKAQAEAKKLLEWLVNTPEWQNTVYEKVLNQLLYGNNFQRVKERD